jgi:predicted RNA methylase
LRFVIAQIYFFGRLVERPIFLGDGQGIDLKDEKLGFSTTIGTAAEITQFIKESGAKKVFEIFSGRGNMTLLLSLAGLEELITVERDVSLDLAASWKSAIDMFLRDIPSIFWPQITQPVFLSGDIIEIDLPLVDCVVMDPPYGYASACYASTGEAFQFFLDVLNRLQKEPIANIYSLVPSEWTSMIHLWEKNPSNTEVRESIHSIFQASVYYQRKPGKWAGFIQAIKEDSYLQKLGQKIGITIQGTSIIKQTPIKNVLGKDLNILQTCPQSFDSFSTP